MAGYGGFAPNNVVGNYLSGRQAADQENAANQTSRARDQQYQQNVLNQQQQQAATDQASQMDAAKQLHLASQYALQAPAGQTKAFVEQNFPLLVQHAGEEWASQSEEDVRAELQGVAASSGAQAGIAPAVAPVQYETIKGPRGSVIQRNPTTNEQKQVVGPDNSQPVAGASGPKFRPLTPEEYTQYGLPTGTTAQMDTATGKIDLINRPTNASAGRPIPPAVVKGLIENRTNIGKIDRALAAIDAYPAGMGAANYLGESIRQRTDTPGVDVRAKVGDIGSLIIHDRSGAAVTVAEMPRLAVFIPQATDDAKVAKIKLQNLKANIQAIQDETESIYSPDAGYKPLGGGTQPQTAPPANGAPPVNAPSAGQRLSPAQAAALPPGTTFVGMDGIPRVKH